MEFVSLNKKIDEAGRDKLRNVQLFGSDNFRSWMLCFEPGDGTPMHYHQSPETFLVIDGKCSVKSIDGHERVLEKNDMVFLPAKRVLPRSEERRVGKECRSRWEWEKLRKKET